MPVSKTIVATLRVLATERGFACEPTLQGTRFRLIDRRIGRAVKNGQRLYFSLNEAVAFLLAAAPAGMHWSE